MLLEKCFAKVYGSYKAIDLGNLSEGFRALTGAPTEYLSIDAEGEEMSNIHKKLE